MKKNIFVFVVIMFIILVPSFSSHAEENFDCNNLKYDQINNALSSVCQAKDQFGLSDVYFSRLEISNPVSIYTFTDGNFIESGAFYPIVYDNHVIATASEITNGVYSIEVALAHTIDDLGFDRIAIIYDTDYSYLYNGTDLIKLSCIIEDVDVSEEYFHDCINLESKNIYDLSCISVTDISNTYDLGFSEEGLTRSYYGLNVSYVTQYPYTNLCWAATIACIKNYLSGTSLTASAVNMTCLNSPSVIDVAMPATNIAYFYQNNYSLNYIYTGSVPSTNAIFSYIVGGHPIHGVFRWQDSQGNYHLHACTVFGCDPNAQTITVMDPSINGNQRVAGYNGSTFSYVIGTTTYEWVSSLCYT